MKTIKIKNGIVLKSTLLDLNNFKLFIIDLIKMIYTGRNNKTPIIPFMAKADKKG